MFSPKKVKSGLFLVLAWDRSWGHSTLAQVKEILRISTGDTGSDNEITLCIPTADGIIDNLLRNHEGSLPLASPPQQIVDASKYLAAALFKERGSLKGDEFDSKKFWNTGLRILTEYIHEKYYAPHLDRA